MIANTYSFPHPKAIHNQFISKRLEIINKNVRKNFRTGTPVPNAAAGAPANRFGPVDLCRHHTLPLENYVKIIVFDIFFLRAHDVPLHTAVTRPLDPPPPIAAAPLANPFEPMIINHRYSDYRQKH
jgi:hypothetical protein